MSEWHTGKRHIEGAPPTPDALGNAGWTILHTSAAAFPNRPTLDQQNAMRAFIEAWSKVYACSHCAYHMRTVLAKKPPVVATKRDVSRYVCELHNDVNYMLGKPTYDCDPDVVLKRWHPTYPHMDDEPTIEEQIEAARAPPSTTSEANKKPSSGRGRWWNAGSDAQPKPDAQRPVGDNETDVSAVLARLKGCQVYCPEKK